MGVRAGFASFQMNDLGRVKAEAIAREFDGLLSALEATTGIAPETRGEGSREMALARTKLEEACFYAKKAVAIQPRFQNNGPVAP